MEHLSALELANIFAFITASDGARIVQTCRSLRPSEPAIETAIAQLIKHRFGAVVGFLHEDDPRWPRSLLTLRCAEVLHVKNILNTSLLFIEDMDVANRSSFFVSRAWTQAWKKRCQIYEQHILQYRPTKKTQHRDRDKGKRKGKARMNQHDTKHTVFIDNHMKATREASTLITCAHKNLIPMSVCSARSKRVIISRTGFHVLKLYTSDVCGYPIATSYDCIQCLDEKIKSEGEEAQKKLQRFENEMRESPELVDVLLRKNGYPNELFSPSISCHGHGSFYLLPKKWAIQWRNYVRNLSDDAPGPILNAELICEPHQRTIVPEYMTMFLSGFSLDTSLQATQPLGACASKQYEIVTENEWEALFDRYCAENAIGFAISNGAYEWNTPQCHICHYGMNKKERRHRRRH